MIFNSTPKIIELKKNGDYYEYLEEQENIILQEKAKFFKLTRTYDIIGGESQE